MKNLRNLVKGIKRLKRRKRGSALILTLAILTIIVIFFISFTMIAISNQRNARLSEALIQARLHSQTGLQLFLTQMSKSWISPTAKDLFPATDVTNEDSLVIPPEANSWGGRRYWVSKDVSVADENGIGDAIHVQLAGIDFTPNTTVDSSHFSGEISWLPLMGEVRGSTQMIGRVCFLAIDESGKIDPNAVVDSAVAEGAETGKNGSNAREIDLTALMSSSTIAQKFQSKDLSPGEMNGAWLSYFNILKGHSDASANSAEIIKEGIFPYSIDLDAANENTDSEALVNHRFDLSRNWDELGNKIDIFPDTFNMDTSAVQVYVTDSTAIQTNYSGIPWIHNGYQTDLKKQIMANLIDYCDADSVPTTDDQTTPTFVGLERVPYINELAFSAEIVGGNLQITVYPELIYPYRGPDYFTDGCNLVVSFEPSSTDLAAPSQQQVTCTLASGAHPWGAARADSAYPGAQYQQMASASYSWALAGASTQVTDLQIKVHYARLTNTAGTLLDYSFSSPKEPLSPAVTVTAVDLKYTSIEVADPRANMNPADWEWRSTWEDTSSSGTTLGSVNDPCTPNTLVSDGDTETATEPYQISTMFIRNGKMKSLWELGAIHRASPWRTINLAKYNDSGSNGFIAYGYGDANILDQVKIGNGDVDAGVTVIGRVNANTYHRGVLLALLSRTVYGADYDDEDPENDGVTYLSTTQAGNIIGSETAPVAGEWLYQNGGSYNGSASAGGSPFVQRGQIADVTKLSDGSVITQTTDRAKEELIGKMAGLITTRPNFFTVIVVAQSIKQNLGVGDITAYDAGQDKILAQQRLMAVVRRDAYTNQFKVIHVEYLDD